jgi:hypothetical protein
VFVGGGWRSHFHHLLPRGTSAVAGDLSGDIMSGGLTTIRLVCSADFSPQHYADFSPHVRSVFVMVNPSDMI